MMRRITLAENVAEDWLDGAVIRSCQVLADDSKPILQLGISTDRGLITMQFEGKWRIGVCRTAGGGNPA